RRPPEVVRQPRRLSPSLRVRQTACNVAPAATLQVEPITAHRHGGTVRTRSCLVSLALALSFGAASATAQQRQITGRVTSATTGDAVVGASVAVVGTTIVAATGNDGRFTVAAPEGDVTLVVRRIGFKRKSVPVPAAQSSVEVVLELDVFNLEAVVVTGLATGVEQRNVANAVSTVGAAQLTRAPTPTIESALQGKIPGALVQMNSGAPGGGGRITLRGVS